MHSTTHSAGTAHRGASEADVTDHDSIEQVTIICVTHQSNLLVESLTATLQVFPHVLVIDNGSSDDTASALSRQLPHAKIIECKSNRGFAKANNEAMAYVDTPFALLLNPDSDIKPEALQVLLDAFYRYPSAGIVAPQSWRPDQKPQMCFRPPFFCPSPNKPYKVPDGICSARWLHGSCLLLRVDAFQHIGGFDENFFLYYEDDDLCLRMHAAGFECLLEPAAKAQHLGGASSTPSLRINFRKRFHYARSRHLAILKYRGNRAGWLYLVKTMLAAAPAALIYAILLQRRHMIKWVAWGCSAIFSTLIVLAMRTPYSNKRRGS
jgi:GT2 family glycosyltransferase